MKGLQSLGSQAKALMRSQAWPVRCPEGWKQVLGAAGQEEEPLLPPQGLMHSPQGGVRVGNQPSPGSRLWGCGQPAAHTDSLVAQPSELLKSISGAL